MADSVTSESNGRVTRGGSVVAGGPPRPWTPFSFVAESATSGVLRCAGSRLGGREEPPHLPGVQHPCPPVETDSPDGERPAEHLRQTRCGALPVTEEQERERVEEVEGRGLAE